MTGTEPTMTPGFFYHGSAQLNIDEFETHAELDDNGVCLTGAFFTQIPAYAACYVAFRSEGVGGRVYRAELVTRNPFFADSELWWAALGDDDIGFDAAFRRREQSLISDIAAQGFDCIVRDLNPDQILEAIVLDKSVIRRVGDTFPVSAFSPLETRASMIFYTVEGLPGPEYAPDCTLLFNERDRAVRLSCNRNGVRPASIVCMNPTYCDRVTWPEMDFELLRSKLIDCLIDPNNGDTLVLDRGWIIPFNRSELRKKRARLRKR